MITWIKLEPIPLKEKVFTARIESQIDKMIAQIKRSYVLPEGMEIENGGDGVLIGSDSNNFDHEAALEKIMLDYPVEWDEQAKEPHEAVSEEIASFEQEVQMKIETVSTVKLVEFLKAFSIHEKIFKKEEVEAVDPDLVTRRFFDVFIPKKTFEDINITKENQLPEKKDLTNVVPLDIGLKPKKIIRTEPTPNIIPFDRRPNITPFDIRPKERILPSPKDPPSMDIAAKLELNSFVNFEEFYGWVLDNSFIISKLKSAFYIANLKSLVVPTREFISSFESRDFVESLEKFSIENKMFSYSKPTYLIWTK